MIWVRSISLAKYWILLVLSGISFLQPGPAKTHDLATLLGSSTLHLLRTPLSTLQAWDPPVLIWSVNARNYNDIYLVHPNNPQQHDITWCCSTWHERICCMYGHSEHIHISLNIFPYISFYHVMYHCLFTCIFSLLMHAYHNRTCTAKALKHM